MSSGSDDDYYEVLGIDVHADDTELRTAWRKLALRWHPDHAGPDTKVIFQRLLAAYTVLSDPAARAAYDRKRGIPAKPELPIRGRAPGVMIWRLSSALSTLIACGIARHADDNVIELLLDANEATEGGMATISMYVPIRCPACAGDAIAPCARCQSTRTIEELYSAWLAIPPNVPEGTVLTPSATLRGMLQPVSFRVRRPG